MAYEDLRDVFGDDGGGKERDRWIGVYIGVLAVILAICAMGGDNAGKDATRSNIEAANTWAFFQAKNLRRQMIRLHVEDLEVVLQGSAGFDAGARGAIEGKIKSYKEMDAKLTSDAKSGEGLDELFHKGKALEKERDLALARDPYFDYGQALLQIAIVLASIAIISGGMMLLKFSFVLGGLGVLMTFNGFTLLFSLPFIG
ncbi:MAG: DUF4337 domain-containing protein [Pseudomonadota bacterium]